MLFKIVCEDLWDFDLMKNRGCTDMVALPPATAPGVPIFLGRNNDVSPDEVSPEDIVLVYAAPDGAPRSLQVAAFGFRIQCGLNNTGLGLGGNMLVADDVRAGVPRLVLVRAILDAPSLLEAQWIGMEDERASSYNNILIHASGEAVQLEGSATDVGISHPGKEGLLWHSNAYLKDEMREHEGKPPEDLVSPLNRTRQAGRLLKENLGHIDHEVMTQILRNHAGYPMSLCRHEKVSCTCFSAIIEPVAQALWIALGHPCKSEYTRFSL
jgi:isopenicillin-N N-acyltransferase-like protein